MSYACSVTRTAASLHHTTSLFYVLKGWVWSCAGVQHLAAPTRCGLAIPVLSSTTCQATDRVNGTPQTASSTLLFSTLGGAQSRISVLCTTPKQILDTNPSLLMAWHARVWDPNHLSTRDQSQRAAWPRTSVPPGPGKWGTQSPSSAMQSTSGTWWSTMTAREVLLKRKRHLPAK